MLPSRLPSLVLAVLVALAALPARAAQPKAASDLAHLLVTKEAWTQSYVDPLSRSLQAQFSGHPGSSLTLPQNFAAKVRGEVEALLPYETLVDIHAKELAAAYSEAELNELIAFHRSPVGQKWIKVMPGVSNKISAETQKRVEPKLPEVMQRLAKDVKPPAGKAGSAPAKKAQPAAPAKAPAAAPAKPPAK